VDTFFQQDDACPYTVDVLDELHDVLGGHYLVKTIS
jgi:hypothetical protein